MTRKLITLCIVIITALSCNLSGTPKLEFSFQLNDKEGFIPSNLIAIWLQKQGGEYIKTFFVCDYLSYAGYTIPDICPDWASKVQWGEEAGEMVDAVTQATPDTGNVVLKFDFSADELGPGKYEYCIEVHVAEKYNELYCGEIEVFGNKTNPVISEPKVTYLPEKYPKGSGLLTNIKVTIEK
jgi:hypothetical protein